MKANLLEYNKSIVGVRLSTLECSYDLGYDRLLFWFETDEEVSKFISRVNNGKLVLRKCNNRFITDDEIHGRKVLEVTDDTWGCNLLETYTKNKSFNIGKSYKYKPSGHPEFDSGSSVTVLDVDFNNGKVIVETKNHQEYLIGLRELV